MPWVRWWTLLVSGTFLLIVSAGCDLANVSLGSIDLEKFDASEVITQEIPYSGQDIVLENLLGKIVVEGVETAVRPILRLEGVKKVRGIKLEEVQISIEQDLGEIRIRSDLPSQVRRNLKIFPPHIEDEVGWVEFTLQVPQEARLNLDQRVGTIEISDFRGELEAATQLGKVSVSHSTLSTLTLVSQAGPIHVSDTSAHQMSVSTQFGELELSDAVFTSARLSVEAGSLAITNIQGEKLTATTQAGSIRISKSHLESVVLKTQAGSLELEVTGLKEGKLSAQFGDIHVEIPQVAASLGVEAKTQLGGIKLFGLESKSGAQLMWGGAWPGQTLTFRLGNDPGVLELSTQLGSIEIQFTK